jgi:hypothetical protein
MGGQTRRIWLKRFMGRLLCVQAQLSLEVVPSLLPCSISFSSSLAT